MSIRKGIVVYCEKHDQGAIVIDFFGKYKNEYEIFTNVEFDKICISSGCSECFWEFHGKSRYYNETGIIDYNCYTEQNYDDYNGGWKTKYFESNVYNLSLQNIDKNIFKFTKNEL